MEIDPLSVYLGSALRARFQQERREAKAAPKPARKRPTRRQINAALDAVGDRKPKEQA